MRRKIVILVTGVFLSYLCACGKDPVLEAEEEKFYECQKGFMGNLGNKICETPEGYYFLMGNYLMFADENMEQKVLVCNKAECLHNRERNENKVTCDAFFDSARALSYYNGKLYLLAGNWSEKQNHAASIYEVELDGSDRREVYSGGEDIQAFCIHRGNSYVYEKKYADEKGNVGTNPILTITKFPVNAPEKFDIIFQTDEYEAGEINGLKCYEEYCYFRVVNFLPQDIFSMEQKINLRTGEVTDCAGDSDTITIGKDKIFSTEFVEEDNTNWTWKNNYYQWELDEKTRKQLTAEEFPILEKNAVLNAADDRYLYFQDVDYGEDAVSEEEQKLYVYTYDGKEVCEILNGGMTYVTDFYAGNEHYLFFYEERERTDGGKEMIFHYVDKEKFGEGAEVETLFRGTYEEFRGEAVY